MWVGRLTVTEVHNVVGYIDVTYSLGVGVQVEEGLEVVCGVWARG